MPSGRLGAADLAAAANTTLFTVPAGKITTFTVSLCNRGSASAKVRLAIAEAAAPINAEYLEYDTSIPANGVLERSGLVAEAGKLIVVRSDVATVSAVAFGFEE